MKLFQQMLVAGASLSLFAPVAAQASDVVNLEEMNSYARSQTKSSRLDSKTFINEVSEDIAILKGRVDGLEVKQQEFEAGGFSDTTVMDQKVVFDLGAMDFSATDGDNETTMFAYSYRMNLNTSFTGDDNMYIRILSGNHSDWMKDSNDGGYLTSVGKSNSLQVDKIWYEFPVGENNTVWVGPKIENYYMHGTAHQFISLSQNNLHLVEMVTLMEQVLILVLVGLTKQIMDLLLVQTLVQNLKLLPVEQILDFYQMKVRQVGQLRLA